MIWYLRKLEQQWTWRLFWIWMAVAFICGVLVGSLVVDAAGGPSAPEPRDHRARADVRG